ncbi:hypothetical protein B566_EDAN005453 [Ephemera danica]|nr:hypothetical protein B566_EDAN005453 [Ephemera danica]
MILIVMATAEHRSNDNYFNEDLVYRVNKRGMVEFGVVIENAELYSSDEDSDNEEYGRLKSGHIRVAWYPKGCEEVVQEKKVGLADRSLMPGDVVRRMIKGKDTQRGYCRYINMKANVQIIGTNFVIPNVKSADLVPLEEFMPDIIVCLDSWVGGIRQVNAKLHLKCPDGSRCIIDDLEKFTFEDVDDKNHRDGEFHHSDFYPGQTLYGPLQQLNKGEWLHMSKELKAVQKPGKMITVMVEQVEIVSVNVHWQCRAYSKDGAGSEKEQPGQVVQGDDLKRLKMINVFEPCSLQVGDRNFYTFLESDVLLSKDQWRRKQKDTFTSMNPDLACLKPKLSPKRTLKPYEDEDSSTAASPAHLAVANELNPLRKSDTDDWDTEDTGSFSDTASLSSSCSTNSQSGKKKKGPALMTKVLKKKKLRRAKKRQSTPTFTIKPGDRVVVETLSTSSEANVVWQDGSVEENIASTLLYPIHHLDDKEFFPGDFVADNREESVMQVYGSVQSVDHAGRTARVKWFRTYTSCDQPVPMLIEDKEVSVYDLKDHPDFQYRPGTVVIRVANFEGEDALCTAGQVLDNFPEGQVQVWWVDNHVSMCWPQDLYKVGEYDSDEGELWDDAGSDASWETQSEEDCYIADVSCHDDETNESLKPKLGANIEKARIAMSRLEEIFTQNPALQTSGVMRQLLDVYKDCRYLDKLMGTSFFHESHFQGLLERVREKGRANLAQRVADQVSRLFRTGDKDAGRETASSVTPSSSESVRATDDSGVYIFNKDSGSSPSESLISGEFLLSENLANLERQVAAAASAEDSISPLPPKSYAEAAKQGTQQEDLPSVNVCVKLCSLIKEQLLKALTEVTARFGGQVSLSRAQLAESPEHKHGIDTTVVGTAPLVTLEDFEEPEQAMEATALPNGPTEQKILGEGFVIEATAPSNHKFVLTMFEPIDFKLFLQTVKKEHKLLNTSLPSGICVKGFEDRMDLYSVMIKGPAKTPYEDGLFFFDFQLSSNYPKAPPVCHYVSYCNDRLNPNLYEDGKVCISLLGTWSG